MKKFVNSFAMSAALVTIVHAFIRDFGALATLKRAALAYFAFFVVGSILAFVFRIGIQDDWAREDADRRLLANKAKEAERLKAEAERQAERDRRKEERKRQLIGEESETA